MAWIGRRYKMGLDNIVIKQIDQKETYDFIINKHYAKRKPSISFAYGLYYNDKLEGICTIGKPASNSLCEGVCGKDYKHKVYELNRLYTNDDLPKNTLSIFVSKVLKDLKKHDLILVSYADEGVGHHGYIYQSTNWIYTGKTKPRTDKYVESNKHSRHYTKEHNHLRVFRSSKHRYIYFATNKTNKKKYMTKLNYSIKDYPKGENENHHEEYTIKKKIINTKTNKIYYE